MGQTLKCKCVNCKYSKKNILLGSGMTQGFSYFPAFDSRRKTVIQLDISDGMEIVYEKFIDLENTETEIQKYKGKIPYFEKSMFRRKGSAGELISTKPLYLQRENNYCPKCAKYKLSFEVVGLFD
jgi:hypothetical protein